jgi:hypothetical protein
MIYRLGNIETLADGEFQTLITTYDLSFPANHNPMFPSSPMSLKRQFCAWTNGEPLDLIPSPII